MTFLPSYGMMVAMDFKTAPFFWELHEMIVVNIIKMGDPFVTTGIMVPVKVIVFMNWEI